MSWDTFMLILFRAMISDLDATCYSDDRVKQILVASAQLVLGDLSFDKNYVINMVSPSITPDPVVSPRDDSFINLTTLKAACMVDMGSLRLAAAISGLEAKCGPAVMKVSRRMEGFGILIDKGYCAAYDEARLQYGFGNANFSRAILSPFVNEAFQPHHHSHDDLNNRVNF